MARSYFTYDNWAEDQRDQGVPLYREYYVEDLRTIELGHWALRDCNAALIQFVGMEGVTEARVQEIPPGGSLKPFKLGVDEMVYVLGGRGFASVSGEKGGSRSFEWSTRSAFVIPRNSWCQLSNMEGNRPVRLLHYNYLPLAMTVIPDPDFFFNNPEVTNTPVDAAADGDLFSEAKSVTKDFASAWGRVGGTVWRGNFFPDLLAWDKLESVQNRGAGGSSVNMYVPNSEVSAHMSVFPSRTYKKGHRHGPGRLIVIPGGEGFTIMWPEGAEKKVFWWHEGSAITPPDQWYHQHFNVSSMPARYFALHPPVQFIGKEEDESGNAEGENIEYIDEDPWIREFFENALAERGLTSAMPEECYKDPNFKFKTAATAS